MFRPPYTQVNDPATLVRWIVAQPFGILVTAGEDAAPEATHIPFLWKAGEPGSLGMLVGHMARANPHWTALDGEREARVIFPGPHGYVSPSVYAEHPSVPTWNYAAVHAIGRPRAVHDAELLWPLLREQIDQYEAGREAPWRPELPEDYRLRMAAGIVGIEMPIDRWEGKAKLSQNRSAAERERVIAALRGAAYTGDRELGEFMDAERAVVFREDKDHE
jgi:transcriptional regulator